VKEQNVTEPSNPSLSIEREVESLSFERGKETLSFERGRFNETSLSLKKYANSPMKEVEIFH
jgi:hypothetical protein